MSLNSTKKRTFNSTVKNHDFLQLISGICVFIGVALTIVFLFHIGNYFRITTPPNEISVGVVGSIGDFIGGVAGTIFSLVGVLLLFLTLREQRQAFHKERFEQRLFEFIRLHRENVSEFAIGDLVKGRSSFKYMLNELRYVYGLVEIQAKKHDADGSNFGLMNKNDYLKLSYLIMFFGIGQRSNNQMFELISPQQKAFYEDYLHKALRDVQNAFSKRSDKGSRFVYGAPLSGDADFLTLVIKYFPFDGHTSRLGHYFRHIFQTIKYIDAQPEDYLSEDEKYEYAKNLRANFSNFEQLMIYFNSLSDLGYEWIDSGLLKKYCLVKNIPLSLINVGPNPVLELGTHNESGRFLWETLEIQERLKKNEQQ